MNWPVNSVSGVLADATHDIESEITIWDERITFLIMGFVPLFPTRNSLLRYTTHYLDHTYGGDYDYAGVHVRSFIFCTRAGGIICS